MWGATVVSWTLLALKMFQFTHPVWGATGKDMTPEEVKEVSIHAPRVGCDRKVGEHNRQ